MSGFVVSLATLLVPVLKEEILSTALGIANAIGLPVSTWQAGDPTRSVYLLESEILESYDARQRGAIGAGFLDYAEGDWRPVVAKQMFNVDLPAATFASTDVVLTNAGGGVYLGIKPNDLSFQCTRTGKTYHNVTGGDLRAKVLTVNGTLTVAVEADEAGSDSTAGATEIDFMVTNLRGVTCSNPTAAIGVDRQDWEISKTQCRDKLGSFSPNGAREAFPYVARNSKLTGTSAVTDARQYGDSDVGEVTVYIRGPSGAVAEPDRALVELAVLKWCTPICITPTVLSVTNVVVPVTYELWIYKRANTDAAGAAVAVQAALEDMMKRRPIGGDIIAPATTGKLYRALVESTIREVFGEDAFNVVVSLPSGDTALTNGQVPALGTVTPTIHIVADP